MCIVLRFLILRVIQVVITVQRGMWLNNFSNLWTILCEQKALFQRKYIFTILSTVGQFYISPIMPGKSLCLLKQQSQTRLNKTTRSGYPRHINQQQKLLASRWAQLQKRTDKICDAEHTSFELPESSLLKGDADLKSYSTLTHCWLLLEGMSMEQGFSRTVCRENWCIL